MNFTLFCTDTDRCRRDAIDSHCTILSCMSLLIQLITDGEELSRAVSRKVNDPFDVPSYENRQTSFFFREQASAEKASVKILDRNSTSDIFARLRSTLLAFSGILSMVSSNGGSFRLWCFSFFSLCVNETRTLHPPFSRQSARSLPFGASLPCYDTFRRIPSPTS